MSGHTPDEVLLEVSRVNLALATGCHYSNGCAIGTIPHDLLQMISGEYLNLLAREHLYRFIIEFIDSRWPSEVHYELIKRLLVNKEILKDVVRQAKHYYAILESEGYAVGSDVLVDFSDDALYAILQYASPEIKGDRDIVLDIVQKYGYALKWASQELCEDPDVVLAAVQQNGMVLDYASSELRGNQEIVLAAVTEYGYSLEYASPELQIDREIVLAAVKTNGGALKFASRELREDLEVVLSAVQNNGLALQYASEELRGDQDIVLAAVTNFGVWPLRYASPELRGDSELVRIANQSCVGN